MLRALDMWLSGLLCFQSTLRDGQFCNAIFWREMAIDLRNVCRHLYHFLDLKMILLMMAYKQSNLNTTQGGWPSINEASFDNFCYQIAFFVTIYLVVAMTFSKKSLKSAKYCLLYFLMLWQAQKNERDFALVCFCVRSRSM